MHLSAGEIRAYQDQELDAQSLNRVRSHLETCTSCQEQAAQMLACSQQIAVRFQTLEPGTPLVFVRYVMGVLV